MLAAISTTVDDSHMQAPGSADSPINIFLSTEVSGTTGSGIRVLHAENKFFSTFGYLPSDLPMSLSSLLADINDPILVSSIELALLTGVQGSHCVNLRSKTNADIAVDLTVLACGSARSITPVEDADVAMRYVVVSIQTTASECLVAATGQTLPPLLSDEVSGEWGTFAVVSADATHNGIGVLDQVGPLSDDECNKCAGHSTSGDSV
jgi:hypothetical protein